MFKDTIDAIFYAAPWVEAIVMSGALIPALGLPLAVLLLDKWAQRPKD